MPKRYKQTRAKAEPQAMDAVREKERTKASPTKECGEYSLAREILRDPNTGDLSRSDRWSIIREEQIPLIVESARQEGIDLRIERLDEFLRKSPG